MFLVLNDDVDVPLVRQFESDAVPVIKRRLLDVRCGVPENALLCFVEHQGLASEDEFLDLGDLAGDSGLDELVLSHTEVGWYLYSLHE